MSVPPDVFVAFHPADERWTAGLIRFLRAHRLRVMSELDMHVGDMTLEVIDQALEQAAHLLVVISPDSVSHPYLKLEQAAMLTRALERGEKRPILPVVLHPAPLSPLLKMRKQCVLHGCGDDGYREGLRQLLAALSGERADVDLIRSDVPLPEPPTLMPTDALWESLLEVYGHKTGNPDGVALLALELFERELLSHPRLMKGLTGPTAANFYLTRLGPREERPKRILDDLQSLARYLRGAPGYERVISGLEQALKPPARTPTPPDNGAVAPAVRFEALLRQYLDTTLELHRALKFIGVNPEITVSLTVDTLYVPLRARIHRDLFHHALYGSHQLERAGRKARSRQAAKAEEALREAIEEDLPLEQAFQRAFELHLRGIVVLGDPGSGKTTLLKMLLVRCLLEGPATLGLPDGIVPVMLPLRALKGTDQSLDAFIQAQLEDNPHLRLGPGFAEALRQRGRLLFLLDGLDEVADEGERIRVSRWIEQALACYKDSFFAVTSRYAGYQGGARLDSSFLELNVRPLEPDEARAFIERWYATVERHLQGDRENARLDAREAADHLWDLLSSEAHRTRRMRELQSNPLLLTILCLVHQRFKTLPQERWRLYDWCVDTLLWHWRKAAGLELPFSLEQSRKLLLPLAFWLHQEEERRQAAAEELIEALEAPFTRLGMDREKALAFLRTIRDRSGLLVGWGVDAYGFIHLAFQEYLAAVHLRAQGYGDLEKLDEAARHFGESWWREVILLLVSLPEPPMFEPFMRRLVREDRFAQPEHRGLLDDCLADASEAVADPFLEVLEDASRSEAVHYAALGALKHQEDPRIVGVCERLSGSAHASVRQLARELLAARGVVPVQAELTAGSVWVHRATGLEFVYVPAGSFEMGGNRYDDERPVHTVTFARGFWIGKYPVTNAQYGLFLKATRHEPPPWWNDSQWNGPEQPVVGVEWNHAMTYCRWASESVGEGNELPPDGSRAVLLPSEAEWEYAARGPKGREYPWGSEAPTPERANYATEGLGKGGVGRTTPVGQYPAGASWVGALDMAGNVWEWCTDHWHGNYKGAPEDGSPWISGGDSDTRVVRGGSWDVDARWLRGAFRDRWLTGNRIQYLGFRVVLVAPDGET